jgi:ABC-type transport system involved in multi-copper enzyme maturation permease subunit
MMTIMLNSLREKIRNKTIYVIGGMGILIITFLMLNADFRFDDKKIVSFEELVPISIIMVNFLGSLLAVMLSLQTIPNEFERKTTHLVLVRGIKKYEYMLGLALSNIIVSLISLLLLFTSIVIFCIIHSELDYTLNILGSMGILSVNIAVISALTSLLSIKIPLFANGILVIVIYFLGVFHNILSVFSGTVGGVMEKVLNAALVVIPNFSTVQREAGNLIAGKVIDVYPIILQLLFLYIVMTLTLFTFRKEI